ncbi:MAG: class I SAM-dependent methyltransferase [Rubrivivax sp.]|nr:class I SAM-dependent methyltransferase [Rubrivivax sp.]
MGPRPESGLRHRSGVCLMRCPACEVAAARHFKRVDARDYWRCDTCEATFLDPGQRLDADAERTYYRSHHNDPADPSYRQFLARLARPLLERLLPAQHGLDYGCGPGPALAAMLREAGHTVALYDPLFFNDPGVLSRRYAFITCTEVVEHFYEPAQEFRRLDSWLEPGGVLAVMTGFLADDARFADWHYRRDPTHVVFYREATFHHLASRHGWRCEIPCPNVALLFKPAGSAMPTTARCR